MSKPRNRFRDTDGRMCATHPTGLIRFHDIDDDFARLEAHRIGLKAAAGGIYFTTQRALAPLFNRASEALWPVCQMLVRWRAGMPMRRSPLERAILEYFQALDELNASYGRAVGVNERLTLERVLADLQRPRKAK